MGSSDYVSDQEAEFSTPHLSKVDLNLEIELAKDAFNLTFNQLDSTKIQKIYPIKDFGHKAVRNPSSGFRIPKILAGAAEMES